MFASGRSPFGGGDVDPLLEELLSSVEEVDGSTEPIRCSGNTSSAKRHSNRPGLSDTLSEGLKTLSSGNGLSDSRPTHTPDFSSKIITSSDRSDHPSRALRPTTLFPDTANYPSRHPPPSKLNFQCPADQLSSPCRLTNYPETSTAPRYSSSEVSSPSTSDLQSVSRRPSNLYPESPTRYPLEVVPGAYPPSPEFCSTPDPTSGPRRPGWSVMGSFLGRLTRSGSCSTGSSSGSGQEGTGEPCTLVSVDRLHAAQCGYNPEYSAPIIGYEVMEERARFTVFKVRVEHQLSNRHWFVFRRYTDFARLNRKLRSQFQGLRFSLPPKRWFGDNFDPLFLEDRLLGLQAFVNNIIAHMDISKSSAVRDFFCFDDPPGPEDSLEESRALCENLEEAVLRLQAVVRQKDKEADLLRAEVSMLRAQQQALLKSLKLQSRLSSVAYAQMLDDQQQQQPMNSSQSKQFLTQMHKVNQFNMALAKTIDRSLKATSYSDQGSRMSLSRVDEENVLANSSSYQKTVSLDDICSRSTGDGSTGSQERLPPVGGVSEVPFIQETSSVPHIVNEQLCSDDSTLTLSFGTTSKSSNPNRDICDSSESITVTVFPSTSPSTNAQSATAQLRDLKLDSVSFKKLLENNPELAENGLKKKSMRQSVVPLSCIPLMTT